MFDKFKIRDKVMLVWIIGFISTWIIFSCILPLSELNYHLDKIEQSIENKNWDEANRYTYQFIDIYSKKRFFILMNNSTEALTVFEQTIGQLEINVKNKQDSALDFVGALKSTIKFVIKAFSGP